MNLWSFSTVKDEEDIIESFVRYNMNILDGMVIYDNCSNDNTLKILKSLKREGYNLIIIEDKNRYFEEEKKKNEILNFTMEKIHPDFVFPLDADEFICAKNGDNPRNIIKKLDPSYLYYYKMEDYVIKQEKNNFSSFVPENICELRTFNNAKSIKRYYKCIISKEIYDKDKIFLEIGGHSAKYINGNVIPSKKLMKLFIAHYPVRSKEQLINKIITGRLNDLSIHSKYDGCGFHQYEIFDIIRNKGTITDKDILKLSKNYGTKYKNAIGKIINKPISIDFCKNIDIKYTNKKDNNILSNTLYTAESVINELREEKQNLIKKNDELNNKIEELLNIKNDYSLVVNSRIWKLRNRIVKLLFWRKNKKIINTRNII